MTTTDVPSGPTRPGRSGPAARIPTSTDNDLARRCTSAFQDFGQSLAATSPSIAIAGTIAVVYLNAGSGTIWSYLLALAVVVTVGYSITVFARRTAAAGSLYTYTSSGLGRGAAFAGGWASSSATAG